MSSIVGQYLGPLFVQETPTGTVNGTNTTFTMSQTPASSTAVNVFLDGLKLRFSVDYTISGVTITLTTAPLTGQILYTEYVKAA